MSQLSLIVKTECLSELRRNFFWIISILLPIAFASVVIYLDPSSISGSEESPASKLLGKESDMSVYEAGGLLVGLLLIFFITLYGGEIFFKAKQEKRNRIMEILSTCVDGKTLMFSKILSVGIVGFIQIVIWLFMTCVYVCIYSKSFSLPIPIELFTSPKVYTILGLGSVYLLGGCILFGSLYAAFGAMTDKNNDYQEYMTIMTILLFGSFYVGEYALESGNSVLLTWCNLVPLTSPTVGVVAIISGLVPLWQSILSIVILYVSAALMVIISGKIYSCTILLMGKKIVLSDIITFLKAR